MAWDRIRKHPEDRFGANLFDYEECAKTFSWAQARRLLDGLPGGGLNITHEAVDRHVLAGRGEKLALRWIGRDEQPQDFTYAELSAAVNRFANVLAQREVSKGGRVFSLLGRVPELYIAALGALKTGSVFSPLFSAFGPEPIKARMTIGEAKVLITSEALYRRKVEPWRKELASLEHVLLTECSSNPPNGTSSLSAAMATSPDTFETVWTGPEDMALLHFTSGTTGRPKGAVHVHEAVVAHNVTGRLALDLQRRGRLLVHSGPRVGDGHFLWHHLSTDQWRDLDRRPGGIRRRTLVSHPGAAKGYGLVHGADRNSYAHEGGSRDRQAVRFVQFAPDGERRRAAQSRGRDLGCRGLRQAVPRQLVADRDRRDHDLEFPINGREARFDGPSVAGHHGRNCRADRGRSQCARSPSP